MTDYPHRWRRVARGGYGYAELVPCRILDKGRARWTIAALRADGTEAVRTVKPTNVVEASSDGALPENVVASSDGASKRGDT